MADVFVASKEKSKNGYGQNGFQGASSDLPGQTTKTAVSDVAPSQVAVPGLRHEATLQARVKMSGNTAAAYTAHDSMRHRGENDTGSPSGAVPKATLRRDSGKKLLSKP